MVLNSLDQMVCKLSDEQENEIEALLDQKIQNYQDQLAMILYIIQITLKGHKKDSSYLN